MWAKIHLDYTPSTHPSHATCTPPEGNKPAPTIQAVMKACHCLIFTTIPHLAMGHCFDTNYSDCFWPGADDYTTAHAKTSPTCHEFEDPNMPNTLRST